jgi:hypothetical protein
MRIIDQRFATSDVCLIDELPRVKGMEAPMSASIKLRSDAELVFQERVDRLRVGLAAGRLHHLADEPCGQAFA